MSSPALDVVAGARVEGLLIVVDAAPDRARLVVAASF
jgi:hypothetical protein